MTKVHCIVLKDCDSGEVLSFGPGSIDGALAFLAQADEIWGHNIIRFDMPALLKLYPMWSTKAKLRDTMVCTQLIWPTDVLRAKDAKNVATKRFPGNMVGRQSLESWGHRIGTHKDWKPESWDEWTEEMQDYCEQDVEVTDKLRLLIESKKYSEVAIQLEHDVTAVMFEQEKTGVCFNEAAAQTLYADLVEYRERTIAELKLTFKPWYRRGEEFTPKRDNKSSGYVKDAPMTKIIYTEFSPTSRDQMAERLMTLYNWRPEQYNDDGSVKLDEAIIKDLKFPPVPLIRKYLLVDKRIGQLRDGKEALMRHVRNGRIHGRVKVNEAITGRASHSKPNLGQVPRVKKDKQGNILHGAEGLWGHSFRSLFHAPAGMTMVGADASSLELLMLAHYLAQWDGGEYAKQVLSGDPHAYTAGLAGITRDQAKTLIYALLYGAGDAKLGKILGKGKVAGKALRGKLLANMPALDKLISVCKARHRERGYLIGLDGRKLYTRSEHAALNTLLQGAGACVCKAWLAVLLREGTYAIAQQILWVHDEVCLYTTPELADVVGRKVVRCLGLAGEMLKLRVLISGEAKSGATWADVH